MAYQVTERLYVDKEGKVYKESDMTERTEAVLLMSAGGELSDEDAKQYGLAAPKPKAADDDDDESEAEAKAVSAPPANKARSASETK